MAGHKAPTDVTIAPLSEKSFFEQLVSRYWIPALLIAFAVTAWMLYGEHSKGRSVAARAASWTELFQAEGASGDLATFVDEHASDDPATPFALLLEATSLTNENKLEEANQALNELKAGYPDHPLVKDTWAFGDGRAERSVVAQLGDAIDAQMRWRAEHPELFENPPPPEDAPRVRIQTGAGDIVVALYPEQAPEHAANFLKLCQEGFYDGTRFHRVLPGFMIQGGDPNSRSEDRETWGLGGPEEKLDPETNDLHHFEGVLSAAKAPGEAESSGSQFFVTVGPAHHLDGEHVIFGAVVEGQDVAVEISKSPIAEGTGDQPAEPVVITGTEVL